MNRKENLEYLSVFKGISIVFVIIGHAILSQLSNVNGMGELTICAVLIKIFIPCVFGFFYISGFLQGINRERSHREKSHKRAKSVFFAYAFWATLCWICFQLLGEEFNQVNNLRDLTRSMPLMFNYAFSIISFSGSWQYYFIWIFLFYTVILHNFKNMSLKQLKKMLIITSTIEIGIISFVTIYLWFGQPSENALSWLGLITFGNPLTQAIPYLGGYYNGAKRKNKLVSKKKPAFIPVIISVFVIAVLEYLHLSQKWQAFNVMDHFTLLSLLNSVLMMQVYDFIAQKVYRFYKQHKAGSGVLSTFGIYSLIPFFIHMPFQWFLFQLTEKLTGITFNPVLAMLVISLYGLILSYFSIVLINKLPIRYKKFLMGG